MSLKTETLSLSSSVTTLTSVGKNENKVRHPGTPTTEELLLSSEDSVGHAGRSLCFKIPLPSKYRLIAPFNPTRYGSGYLSNGQSPREIFSTGLPISFCCSG